MIYFKFEKKSFTNLIFIIAKDQGSFDKINGCKGLLHLVNIYQCSRVATFRPYNLLLSWNMICYLNIQEGFSKNSGNIKDRDYYRRFNDLIKPC